MQRFTHATPSNCFLSLGTTSDPRFNPLPELRLVDVGLKPVGPYGLKNQYLLNGFVAGLYYWLFTFPEAKVIVHVQDRTLLGRELSHLEGMDSLPTTSESNEAWVCAPRWTPLTGESLPDTGFILMSREAVIRYLSHRQRAVIESTPFTLTVEEDLYNAMGRKCHFMFGDEPSIRARSVAGILQMSLEKFLSLPVASVGKHCPLEWAEEWKTAYPVP